MAGPVYREEIVVDRITVLEDGQLNCREAIRVYKDDVLISQRVHATSANPGNSISHTKDRMAGNDETHVVERVIDAVHTPAVVTTFDYKDAIYREGMARESKEAAITGLERVEARIAGGAVGLEEQLLQAQVALKDSTIVHDDWVTLLAARKKAMDKAV